MDSKDRLGDAPIDPEYHPSPDQIHTLYLLRRIICAKQDRLASTDLTEPECNLMRELAAAGLVDTADYATDNAGIVWRPLPYWRLTAAGRAILHHEYGSRGLEGCTEHKFQQKG